MMRDLSRRDFLVAVTASRGRSSEMACQDLAGTGRPADFDWFEYRERPYVVDVSQLELL
jgi:beta-xylosidase